VLNRLTFLLVGLLLATPSAWTETLGVYALVGGRIVTVTPEFADVARIAREKALPVREVLDQARADGRRLLLQ